MTQLAPDVLDHIIRRGRGQKLIADVTVIKSVTIYGVTGKVYFPVKIKAVINRPTLIKFAKFVDQHPRNVSLDIEYWLTAKSDADWKQRRLKSLKSDHKWGDFDDKYIVYQVKDYFNEYVDQLSDDDRKELIAELGCEVVAFKKVRDSHHGSDHSPSPRPSYRKKTIAH